MANDSTSTTPSATVPVPSQSESKQSAPRPRAPRAPRPNFKQIYRFPLPINVHPLPPLIPHNPLSIVSVLLSYLTYFIAPPHQEVYPAYFDADTSSVHVTDEKAIRALWEMGFFGKGTLSRSEPSWLGREKKRRGLLGTVASEDMTRQRRSERRELKLERARMERVAVEERLKAEAEAAARDAADSSVDHNTLSPSADGLTDGTAPNTEKFSLRKAREARYLESRRLAAQDREERGADPAEKRPVSGKTVRFSPVVQAKEIASDEAVHLLGPIGDETGPQELSPLQNEEHLQLSNEEAFFLAYGLGTLDVYDGKRKALLPASSLLPLFCQHSHFPPRDPSVDPKPDDPFLVSYAVYHHFRSLGWVVRSGVKFGVDYLLYNRGPVFSHAEFAVVVIPSYDHPYWSETEARRAQCDRNQSRSWWWLHCVNRVQAQVKKSLVICYVEVPPPGPCGAEEGSTSDIGGLLSRYSVREMVMRRWVPNRTRD